ncbi:helix-turn-helix transcriptional regulator [Enterococcus sp.]|uniref:helix-turn-helix domain-containing protein n=1 Tax=Enterococcus sp. TaxID=35783 RepID=UPI002896459A|nr:helix-turn-helix transcriptional regulator [Enterococcus sp.]
MTSNLNSFGARLKDLRLRAKLTQQQLGDIVHVSKVSISGYERGERSPDTETLRNLANYFEVSVDYLLNGHEGYQKEWSDSFDKPNDMIRTVAAHIDEDATEEDLEDILRYIEYRKNNPLKKKK